ncbi:MAG: hypothetical protein NC926_09260 [Candidatus Omnitrophica bacterium]|nr:hypothetical protein [Candidatus Omnitrophota bacterium]
MNIQEVIVKIFTNWPVPTVVGIIVIFLIFKGEISNLLNRIKKVGKNGILLTQESSPIDKEKIKLEEIKNVLETRGIKDKEDLEKTFEWYEKEIINSYQIIKLLFFSYLNLYLVYNSKFALLMFKNSPMSKETFKRSFYLPPEIPNPEYEKEVIFSTLLQFKLIEEKGNGVYFISPVGEEFLKFIGWLPEFKG